MSKASGVKTHQPSGIKYGPRIWPPEHEYRQQNLSPELTVAFNGFAAVCMEYFGRCPTDYPNAVMQVEPTPAHLERGTASFLVLWGAKTELPLPRPYKLADYFGALAVKLGKHKRISKEKVITDANGFFGRLHLDNDGVPTLDTVFGEPESTDGIVTSRPVIGDQFSLAFVDVASDLMTKRPLRFHAGVKWHSYNGYVGNEYYADDESHLLGLI